MKRPGSPAGAVAGAEIVITMEKEGICRSRSNGYSGF